MINENIRHGDLEEVVDSLISVDEFEPKTGKKEDVSVIGFHVTEEKVGADLKNFLQKSHFDFRDVEVTPNPNEDNMYMVFVEVDRKEGLLSELREYVLDLENVSGKINWKVKPLLSDDKEIIVAYNGEIYNQFELRKKLIEQNVNFKSLSSDTEVVLKGYIAWGEDLFKKIDGQFAIVIIDLKKKEVIIGRDKFGEKPVFYFVDEKKIDVVDR